MDKPSPHQDAVRTEVLRWLDQCHAFRELDDGRRRRLAVRLATAGSLLAHDALWFHPDEASRPEVAAAVRGVQRHVSGRMGIEGVPGDPGSMAAAEAVRMIDHGDFVEVVIEHLLGWVRDADDVGLAELDEALGALGDLPLVPRDAEVDRARQRELATLLVQLRDREERTGS